MDTITPDNPAITSVVLTSELLSADGPALHTASITYDDGRIEDHMLDPDEYRRFVRVWRPRLLRPEHPPVERRIIGHA